MRVQVAIVACFSAAVQAFGQVPAGPEFQVNTYTTARQASSSVAVDSSGRFTAAWIGDPPMGPGIFDVYGQRYRPDGSPDGGNFQVNLGLGGLLPAVTYARAGNSWMSWSGSNGADLDIYARGYDRHGRPRGGEFRVNTLTSGNQYRSAIAPLPGGGFVVAWTSFYLFPQTLMVRRYDAFGAPRGAELEAATTHPNFPAVAADDAGRFVVVWKDASPLCCRVAARLFDSEGDPAGPAFTVGTASGYAFPDVAMSATGTFVAVWETAGDGDGLGIRGRRFSAGGTPLGVEFVVNAVTAGPQRTPKIAMDRGGEFVVAWSTLVGGAYEAVARRFAADASPRSGEFALNTYTTGHQNLDDVATDGVGNFVATWTSEGQDGDATGVFGRRFGGLLPATLSVDPAAGPVSDGNGVLEPGESVAVVPSWRNESGVPQAFSGILSSFSGPPGPGYALEDALATYKAVPDGENAPCWDCYAVGVSAPSGRPSVHWDAAAREELAPDVQGQKKTWLLHVGDSFGDVPRSSPYYRSVETLLHRGVTSGCAASNFCPEGPVLREQMAVFVVAARDAAGDPPPPCGAPVFNDVPATSVYCRWIEELARAGVVGGCGGGNYCPQQPVSREAMAVFVLRTFEPTLSPPPCGVPLFADVPATSPYCPWIEELARRGVVAGCGGGNYCPAEPVTRAQMAAFITATLGLRLYGP